MYKQILITVFVISLICSCQATEKVRVATWNIEHLGSPGRGLGGIGSGNLPMRTVISLPILALRL